MSLFSSTHDVALGVIAYDACGAGLDPGEVGDFMVAVAGITRCADSGPVPNIELEDAGLCTGVVPKSYVDRAREGSGRESLVAAHSPGAHEAREGGRPSTLTSPRDSFLSASSATSHHAVRLRLCRAFRTQPLLLLVDVVCQY